MHHNAAGGDVRLSHQMILRCYAVYPAAVVAKIGAVLALARCGGGRGGSTIPAGGAGEPQYVAELRIYWRILQLN